MNVPRGVQVLLRGQGRFYLDGERSMFRMGGMRFAIPHPDRPDKIILFGPEDVIVLFHPEFMPDSVTPVPATQP